MFDIYLKLGFQHILDYLAYDHILFVMALCAVYNVKDWKKVLVLVTAFTIGHSITLALSVFNILRFDQGVIETLIPITIILTCLYNVFMDKEVKSNAIVIYMMAVFFGLIHGMGFSNYLNVLLDSEESKLMPLLGFNLGVECGQVIIIILSMLLSYVFVTLLKVKQKYWAYTISTLAILIAIHLLTKS
jgi:ABC-type antimicrobial peptide transport system permease subunit